MRTFELVRIAILFLVAPVLAACAPSPATEVAGRSDGATSDAGVVPDSGAERDAASEDAASPEADAGTEDAAVARRSLSQTGLYSDISTRALAPRVMSYSVRSPLWADGAEKDRYLLLPEGTQIDTSDMNGWRFPVGTKAWKTFTLGDRTIETRLLEKTGEGPLGWTALAFLWAEDGHDAYAEEAGVANALGTDHDVPSAEECVTCHRGAADVLIGVSALQVAADSLDAWRLARLFTQPLPVDRDPPGEGVARDVLAYVNAHCGHCHNDRHPLAMHESLRLALPLGIARPEDTPLYRTAICAPTVHRVATTTVAVAPGDPEGSQLRPDAPSRTGANASARDGGSGHDRARHRRVLDSLSSTVPLRSERIADVAWPPSWIFGRNPVGSGSITRMSIGRMLIAGLTGCRA